MSKDYKKIALEDVKKGQRIRIVERHSAYTATYESVVLRTHTKWHEIGMGEEGDEITIFVTPNPGVDFDILLLEDVPKPKVVRTEVVTITHYDDGTKTEALVKEEVKVPMVIETPGQFEEYEEYLKKARLRDKDGDYWKYRDGHWCWETANSTWRANTDTSVIEASIPLTIVENVGD